MVLLVAEVGRREAKLPSRGVGGTESGSSCSFLGISGLGVVMLATSSMGEKGIVPSLEAVEAYEPCI